MSRFEQDLLFGQETEGRVRDLLQFAGALTSKFGNDNKNDFQVVFNNKTHRVEVKNEDRMSHTGNICIEMYQGMPMRFSGIAISEANIFIHTLKDRCVLYRRAQMYSHLRSQYAEKRLKMRPFGDNYNQGFIVRTCDLLQYGDWFDLRPTSTIADSHLWLG